MYLRDSQGKLRWFPPASQGLDPFADPSGPSYAMQFAMIRQQMQQEEWMRFHAPPTGDQVHFQTKEPAEYVAVRPPEPVSMSRRTSTRNNPTGRPFNNGSHPTFESGPAPRPRFELPVPNPRATAHMIRNPAPTPSLSRSDRSTRKPKEADFPAAANVSCMNTLFGAQIKQQHTNVRGTMLCNQVDPPSTPEIDIKLPAHYNMDRLLPDGPNSPAVTISESTKSSNPLQIFLCNGVRGPPKKFDYSFKPALPQCHGNSDVFYDALQDETSVPKPPIEQDVLSEHDSFDDKTFLMDVDIVNPKPQRKKKGVWKEKLARGTIRQGKDSKEQYSPDAMVGERDPHPKGALEPTMEEYREPVESRDSIEAARESPPSKNLVIDLKVQRQPVLAVHESPPKGVEVPEILSEDSKDAMYESVTNRKKPDPINLFQHYAGHAAIIFPTDMIQKIASRDIVPSPETILMNGEANMTPEHEHPAENESASIQNREAPRKSRSRRPKTGSKSKSTRGKSAKKFRDAELSAKDQAALAQSIREICLRATPELNGEDYPSFDEPQPKDGQESNSRPGRDSPASETSCSTGGENTQQVANKEKKKNAKRRSKKEKSKRSSSMKPSSRKEVKDVNSGDLRNDFESDDMFNELVPRPPGACTAWQTLEQH